MSYNDLVNVPSFGKKRESTFDPDRGDLAYYCRDCLKTVDAVQIHPAKHRYECPLCKGHNISVGTVASIKEIYSKHR